MNSKFEEKRQLWFYDRTIKPIEFDLVVVFFSVKIFSNNWKLHRITNENICMRSVLVWIPSQTIFFQLFGVVSNRIYPVERKIQSKILFLPTHCAYIVRGGDQFFSTGSQNCTPEKKNWIFVGIPFYSCSIIFCYIRIFLTSGCKNLLNFKLNYFS